MAARRCRRYHRAKRRRHGDPIGELTLYKDNFSPANKINKDGVSEDDDKTATVTAKKGRTSSASVSVLSVSSSDAVSKADYQAMQLRNRTQLRVVLTEVAREERRTGQLTEKLRAANAAVERAAVLCRPRGESDRTLELHIFG